MTEYLLRIHWGRETVHGIRYPSAAHPGGVCVVLDVSADDCLEVEGLREPDRLQMQFVSHVQHRGASSGRRRTGRISLRSKRLMARLVRSAVSSWSAQVNEMVVPMNRKWIWQRGATRLRRNRSRDTSIRGV